MLDDILGIMFCISAVLYLISKDSILNDITMIILSLIILNILRKFILFIFKKVGRG